jgi:capsular polysaccharide transport system permease protein
MPYAFFLLNGFVLLKTFVGPAMAGIGAISSNSGLLVFPKVRPLDILLARFLFELVSSLFSFTIFSLIGLWIGIQISLAHLHILLATFIITWLLGSGTGLVLAVGTAHFQSLEKIFNFIKRPLIFVSCILYPLYNLPNVAQKILLYNPLVHTIELSRKSMFPLYHIGQVNLFYPTAAAIIVCAVGTCMFHNNRHILTLR